MKIGQALHNVVGHLHGTHARTPATEPLVIDTTALHDPAPTGSAFDRYRVGEVDRNGPVRSAEEVLAAHPQLGPITSKEAYVNAVDVTAGLLPPGISLALTGRPSKKFSQVLDAAQPYGYQQQAFKPVDPLGDACLIKRCYEIPAHLFDGVVRNTPGKMMAVLKSHFGKGETEAKSPAAGPEQEPFEAYKEPPLKVDALVNQFMRDIQDSPYPPYLGEEHKWSPEAGSFLHFGFARSLGRFAKGKDSFPAPLLGCSKLFLMLADGQTSRYAVTGQEEPLHTWLMGQKDFTVKPHDLLRESYNLNKGNLYMTFMTVENLLSRDWTNGDRANFPEQQKLAYIRNDSSPHGDKFGAWYHMYGAALYALMRPPAVAKFVGETEAVGSYILSGPDPQEDHMNRQGAEFGSKVRKMMQDGTWEVKVPPDAETNYLTGRNWQLERAQQA